MGRKTYDVVEFDDENSLPNETYDKSVVLIIRCGREA